MEHRPQATTIENQDSVLRRRDRDTEVVEGKGYGEAQPIKGSGSIISTPVGSVAKPWPKMDLVHFELKRTHLTTTNSVYLPSNVTLHYIQNGTKSGQGSELGTIQCPGDLVIFLVKWGRMVTLHLSASSSVLCCHHHLAPAVLETKE